MENSNNTDNQQNSTPVHDTTQLLGQRFKQAREKKGLSIDDVAAKTFILKSHLRALEANDFDALPQPTFARGFATTYGRFLGLDKNLVAQSFDAQYPATLKQKYETVINAPMQPMGTLNREARPSVRINPFVIGGILLVLGLAIFIFNKVSKAHNDSVEQAPASAVASMPTQDQVSGASLNNAGSAIVTNTVTASGLPATGSAITGVAVSADNASGTAATGQAGAKASIDIFVKDTTKITIVDATGNTILDGDQARGSYQLTGQAPFQVNIDKASNVSLDLNKQPIKLSNYAQNDKANFTLKP